MQIIIKSKIVYGTLLEGYMPVKQMKLTGFVADAIKVLNRYIRKMKR